MIVLSVYYTHKPGGFCKRLYRLLAALSSRSDGVHYFALDEPPINRPQNFHFHKIPFPFKSRRGLFFWGLFTLWCPVWLLFAGMLLKFRHKKMRLLAFGAYYSTLLTPLKIFSRSFLVLFLRSLVFKIDLINGKPAWLRAITEAFERFGVRRADRVVCMSSTMKTELLDFLGVNAGAAGDALVLPNDLPKRGDDCSKAQLVKKFELAISENTLVLLTAGVLDARKNVEHLLKCLFELCQCCPDVLDKLVLLIAGSGPLESELHRMVSEYGLKNVRFLGWQENLPKLLGGIDLLLHPALHEGIPNIVMEALAIGKPVLCSNVPEHIELLSEDALLFDVSSADALKKALMEILSDANRLKELGQLSSKVATRFEFDWDSNASELVL